MTFRTPYGNTHSENRWRMCDRNECDLVRIPELYMTETAPLRKGAPLVILGAWLFWYDRNVEEIETSVWGWSATNDVANSNHLSGTAIDVNAPKYPWGLDASANMTPGKIAKIREGLAKFEGSVFWGQDWGRKDPMHYQMAWAEGDARNEAFAKKLQAGHLGIYKTAPQPEVPVADPNKLASLVDGSLHTRDEYIQYNDRYLWRINKMLTAMAKRDGLPFTDAALKQVGEK